MDIVIPLFDRFTALDAVGPYEVLSRLPGAEVRFAAAEPGLKKSDAGGFALEAPHALGDIDATEVLVVPGGPGTRDLIHDKTLTDWIRDVHPTTTWTTSVCTGSLLLAAAGLLDGVPATTHWSAMELLGELGAKPVAERVVAEDKIVTSAGVSAGIDMALSLTAIIAGEATAQAIQLSIEYDPQPPFNAGSVETAPADVVEMLKTYFARRAAR